MTYPQHHFNAIPAPAKETKDGKFNPLPLYPYVFGIVFWAVVIWVFW